MTKLMKPSDIFYTQHSILEYFKNGISIQSTSEDIQNGRLSLEELPKIRVFYEQNKCHRWMSLDNRRLWVYKQLELARFLEKVSVQPVQPDPMELNRKFTTMDCGKTISIRKRQACCWVPSCSSTPTMTSDYSPIQRVLEKLDSSSSVIDYEKFLIAFEYEAEEFGGYDSENEEEIPALKTYRQNCRLKKL